ncbi:MAG: DMT family transporter [Rhodobacteraceae bacterium]|nr:DMT family transporter [Paracoccaceae bacterium]
MNSNFLAKIPNTLLGGFYIIPSMFVIGLIDNFVRFIALEAGVWQFHFLRSIIGCIAIIVFCIYQGHSLWPQRPGIVFIRSVLIASSMILYFGSLALMPIAEAGAALFSSPIFILGFSVLFFKTKVGLLRILCVVLGSIGVLMVLKPDIGNFSIFTIFPLMAGALYAMGQILTRHYCANEKTSVLLFGFFAMIGCFGFGGSIILTLLDLSPETISIAPFFLSGWKPITSEFIFWTVIQASGSLLAVAGLIKGYQVAEPTFVTIFEYSFLIFAGFWGWVIWSQIPDAIGIFGIALIIGAGIVITIRSLPTQEMKQ